MSVKSKILLSIVAVIAAIVVVFSMTDIGTSIVKSQGEKVLSQTLNMEVSIAKVGGNPIKGYSVEGVKVGSSLAIPKVVVKPSLISVLSGKIHLDKVVIDGVESDYKTLKSLSDSLPKSEEKGGDLPLSKLAVANSKITLPDGNLIINNLEADLAGDDLALKLDCSYRDLPIKGSISGNYDGTVALVKKGAIEVGSGKISLEGDLAPDLAATANLVDLNLGELSLLWPGMKSVSPEGAVSTSIKAEGTLMAPLLSGVLTFDGAIASVPVKISKGDWRYENLALDVPLLEANLASVPLKGKMSLLVGAKKPKLQLDLSASNADLDVLRKSYGSIPKELSGVIDEISLSLNGSVDSLKGGLKARAKKISAMGENLSDSWLSADLVGSDKVTLKGKTILSGQPFNLNGTLTMAKTGPTIDMALSSSGIKTSFIEKISKKKIPVKGDINLNVTAKGEAQAPSLKGHVSAKSLSGWNQTMSNVALTFSLSKDILNIESFKGAIKGASLALNGKVLSLTTKPELNISGSLKGLNPSALEKDLGLEPKTVQGNVDVSFSVKGDVTNPLYEVGSQSQRFRVKGVLLQNLDLLFKGDKSGVKIEKASANVANGKVSSTGSIFLGKTPKVDLSLSAVGIDSSALASVPVKGTIDLSGQVKGDVKAPKISIKANSKGLSLDKASLSNIEGELAGADNIFTLSYLRAQLEGTPIEVKGKVDVSKKEPKGDFNVACKGVDLQKVGSKVEFMAPYDMRGKLDITFDGKIDGSSVSGSGVMTAPSIQAMNVKLTDLRYDLKLTGSKLTAVVANGKLYGGTIKGQGFIDFSSLAFSKEGSISKVDIAPLIRDFTGEKGTLTGLFKCDFKGAGKLSPFTFKGKGTADLSGGKIVGFPIVDVAANLHGTDSIAYKSAHSNFRVEDLILILDDGTIIQARDKDPIYRYMSATGKIGPEKKLNLLCKGEVNIKLLNAVVGAGIGGVAGGGVGTLAAVVGGILGGAQQGVSMDDFRDISFNLRGTLQSPSARDFKVGPSKLKQDQPQAKPTQTAPVEGEKTEPAGSIEDQLKKKLEEEATNVLQDLIGGKN